MTRNQFYLICDLLEGVPEIIDFVEFDFKLLFDCVDLTVDTFVCFLQIGEHATTIDLILFDARIVDSLQLFYFCVELSDSRSDMLLVVYEMSYT